MMKLLVLVLAAMMVGSGCSGPAPLTIGVAADDLRAVDDFDSVARTRAGVYQWYEGWAGTPAFDTARADAARARGALPLLTWEPWVPGAGAEQPDYALASIADGSHDAYITAFARQVRIWGGRLGLRFLHEMNAPFYPWGAGVNGNTPAAAVRAWNHVREIFSREGADDVVWIWCMNAQQPGYADYASLYPGDDAVDWVAVDGYNGGDALPWGGWRTPQDIFGPSIADLHRLTGRPVAITETASAEQGGDKAAWIRDLFALATAEDVRVLIWFQYAKETDWRVQSSPAAAAAFQQEAAVPGRLGSPPLS
jgi:glycosyl hydrolase family 26